MLYKASLGTRPLHAEEEEGLVLRLHKKLDVGNITNDPGRLLLLDKNSYVGFLYSFDYSFDESVTNEVVYR